jgi:hypothetical protein
MLKSGGMIMSGSPSSCLRVPGQDVSRSASCLKLAAKTLAHNVAKEGTWWNTVLTESDEADEADAVA